MVEGLYHGWDELRAVPSGQQGGMRVIVLFTGGASNGVPGDYGGGSAKSLRTWDFPKSANDPDNQTWNSPHLDGLYDTLTGATRMCRQIGWSDATGPTVPCGTASAPRFRERRWTATGCWPTFT